MKIRFQADADIDPDIRKGLLRREPSIDFQPAAGVIADGTLDPEVLAIAADDDRVLVSGDLRTIPYKAHPKCVTSDLREARFTTVIGNTVVPTPEHSSDMAFIAGQCSERGDSRR